MREILFRGKTKTGFWIEGFLFQTECDGVKEWCISMSPLSANDYSEILGDYGEVIPETVGQYTGLTDKNGNKIFEGDIVSTKYKLGRGGYYVFEVYYNENLCQFALTINSGSYTKNQQYDWLQLTSLKAGKVEVIRTIHDNPELLKGEE